MVAFQDLTAAQQTAVIQAALKGQHHPDPEYAWAGYEWAAAQAAPSEAPIWDVIVDFVVGLFTGVGGWSGMAINRRIYVRKLLALGPPPQPRPFT